MGNRSKSRLKVLNAIVCNISDSSSGERRNFRYFDISVGSELFLQRSRRISFDSLVWTCLDHLEGVFVELDVSTR